MSDSEFPNLTILDVKIIFKDGSNRLCYLLPCDFCKEPSYHPRYAVLKSIKNRKEKFFCNHKCKQLFYNANIDVICETCEKQFTKQSSQMKITKHNFCSRSCAAIYHNKHKTTGTRRSKLEIYLESEIKNTFKEVDVYFNDIKTIKSELDIFFPKLKLAIQINGPLHFKPIYGEDKFKRIVELDNEKRIICKNLSIKLIEIDVSKDTSFIKARGYRWNEVKNIIENSILLCSQGSV